MSLAQTLKGKTAFITGASRGIGLSIGRALASRGANVVVAAKSATPHPKLPGTIHTASQEIDEIGSQSGNGVKGLAIQLDVRDAEKVSEAFDCAAQKFGGIDIVVNNASAINMQPTAQIPVKAFDLMSSINSRGTFLVTRSSLPYLEASSKAGKNPHILTLSPPLHTGLLSPSGGSWPAQFAQTGSAYTVSKLGMSLVSLAVAAETKGRIGVNALWPYTMIGTSAMKIVSPNAETEEKRWRSPEIVADAAARIIEQDGSKFTAQFLLDEAYLRSSHNFTDEQIRNYSLGGADWPLEDLAEDLYISDSMRREVLDSRRS
ncbi:short-chain dehydrogenase [Ceraceosorus bombacis]|uniref:Hydroxysteroid dehydrogenase-like protein 2 n=1 Tax=Ceraceosorus bombacis TaxID=401625 RepID=A0A0P1B940_9BASI|nr:short-chain dehydrogenase [Ceraceosorus bombacis]